jgi:hypothetical protein
MRLRTIAFEPGSRLDWSKRDGESKKIIGIVSSSTRYLKMDREKPGNFGVCFGN